jgi:hypothetical protein
MKELLKKLWQNYGPKIHEGIEGLDLVMDALLLLGMVRHSKRRDRPVPSEKFFPSLTITTWHKNRDADLRSALTEHEERIIDNWVLTLEKPAQDQWIVSMANKSWGPTPEEEVENTKRAVRYYKHLAALRNDDERTAFADSEELIRDPATEYLQAWLQQQAGRTFRNFEEALKYIRDNWRDVLQHIKDNAAKFGRMLRVPVTEVLHRADNALEDFNARLDNPDLASPGVRQRIDENTDELRQRRNALRRRIF